MKFILLMLSSLTLSACASISHPAFDAAKAEFERYEKARLFYSINLYGVSDGEETDEHRSVIKSAWDKKIKSCSQEFERFENIKKEEDLLIKYSELKYCAAAENIEISANWELTHGRTVEHLLFLKEFKVAAQDLEHQTAINNEFQKTQQAKQGGDLNNFLILFALSLSNSMSKGYHLNPQTHYVNPYFRSDGVYVQPHIRTNPNQYCFDNINACR